MIIAKFRIEYSLGAFIYILKYANDFATVNVEGLKDRTEVKLNRTCKFPIVDVGMCSAQIAFLLDLTLFKCSLHTERSWFTTHPLSEDVLVLQLET